MNPKRYSQIERAMYVLDKSGTSDILKDDHYLLFLFKKTERIVTALYIMTTVLSDVEPLKWQLRDTGLTLLKDTLSFRERTLVQASDFLNEVLAGIVRCLALLQIAYTTDLVSSMNFSILKKELEGLSNIIVSRGKSAGDLLSPPFLDENFFGISKTLFEQSQNLNLGGISISGVGERKSSDERPIVRTLEELELLRRPVGGVHKGQSNIKDNVLYNKRTQSTQKNGQKQSSDSTVVRRGTRPRVIFGRINEERKRLVLEVVQEKGIAMIKDFVGVIGGCSEKTIQRRLLELVHDGVLKKDGERRWSKYSRA